MFTVIAQALGAILKSPDSGNRKFSICSQVFWGTAALTGVGIVPPEDFVKVVVLIIGAFFAANSYENKVKAAPRAEEPAKA